MGDRAMMSAYYPKSGQRPEDNVRAIADALAVYLAWSFRNSITQVKKATPNPAETPESAIDSATAPVTTLPKDLATDLATATETMATGQPASTSEATIEPIVQGPLRCQSVNLKRIAQRRRSKLRDR